MVRKWRDSMHIEQCRSTISCWLARKNNLSWNFTIPIIFLSELRTPWRYLFSIWCCKAPYFLFDRLEGILSGRLTWKLPKHPSSWTDISPLTFLVALRNFLYLFWRTILYPSLLMILLILPIQCFLVCTPILPVKITHFWLLSLWRLKHCLYLSFWLALKR